MRKEQNTQAMIRIYSALRFMDKNIQRVQAIADGCPVSLSSKERSYHAKGTSAGDRQRS